MGSPNRAARCKRRSSSVVAIPNLAALAKRRSAFRDKDACLERGEIYRMTAQPTSDAALPGMEAEGVRVSFELVAGGEASF